MFAVIFNCLKHPLLAFCACLDWVFFCKKKLCNIFFDSVTSSVPDLTDVQSLMKAWTCDSLAVSLPMHGSSNDGGVVSWGGGYVW